MYKDDNIIIEDKKSMDGKTANASDRKSSKEGEIAKTNAMSTQTATIDYIVDNFGYYVAPVKGNQGNLLENIKPYFDDESLLNKAQNKGYRNIKEKARGTIEEREYIFTDDINWLYKKDEWKVENSLHFYLDVVFREDNNKCFLQNSQKNLNIIRKFCLAILKSFKSQTKLSMNSIRYLIFPWILKMKLKKQ